MASVLAAHRGADVLAEAANPKIWHNLGFQHPVDTQVTKRLQLFDGTTWVAFGANEVVPAPDETGYNVWYNTRKDRSVVTVCGTSCFAADNSTHSDQLGCRQTYFGKIQLHKQY